MRPDHLPDFRKPPLNEVVLGVQFKPVPGYQQIRAGEVWGLFKERFPRVQELPPLPPAFETFGPGQQIGQFNFGLVTGGIHDRFWFMTAAGDELLQFQQDRLLHNWRKVGDQTNEYPRFERMIENFAAELGMLRDYFQKLASQGFAITQCEISYVNHILSPEPDRPICTGDWLRFLNFGEEDLENFATNFRRVIASPDGRPLGRLIGEASMSEGPGGRRYIVFTLTARGAPMDTSIEAAVEFLKLGRDMVVSNFAKLTTDSAHRMWERIQ